MIVNEPEQPRDKENTVSNFESGPINLHDDGKPLRWEDAAKRVTVHGFACAKCNRFYGDGDGGERAARYCCHTDAPCECGNRKGRHRVLCDSCYHKSQVKRWHGLEQVAWDGKAMLTTLDGDRYFDDFDEFIEWCLEQKIMPSDSFVIHCETGVVNDTTVHLFVMNPEGIFLNKNCYFDGTETPKGGTWHWPPRV